MATHTPILGNFSIFEIGSSVGAYVTRRHWLARWLNLTPTQYAVGVERGVAVPMPDGVRLIADHYFPKADSAFPTILIRTPYGRDFKGGVLGFLHMFFGQRFAERGYHVIIQDVRGRFDSQGKWEPFVDEKRDGLATLGWIARQPWFDGNLGMWGQSYGGYVQWAVAGDAPDFFKAMVPSITGTQINPYTGSAFGLMGIFRWVYILTRTGNWLKLLAGDFFRFLYPAPVNKILNRAYNELPIEQADVRAVGEPVPYFRKWIAPGNARMDAPFWQSVSFRARMKDVRAAAFFVGGWYDVFLYDLLADYDAMIAAGHRPNLTIGPWKHFDLACVAESLRGGIVWFDAILKNRRQLRAKPVRLFVMGANEWREYASFPVPVRETQFYLRANRTLSLESTDTHFAPDCFHFDPAEPPPTFAGPLYHPSAGAQDNRLLEMRKDVLTYTTAPLQKSIDVIGRVRLQIFARSTAPSFDIFARLCDVYPDGRSINICDGLTRVDPGVGEQQSDGSVRVIIDLWATANCFLRGHRIRLLVMGGQHPRWMRNLGTTEPFATATRMVVADTIIYHDATHPSALVLPIEVT